MSFQGKTFLVLAVASLTGLGIYLTGLYDDAGAILLGGCAVFGLWAGTYLLLQHRAVPEIDDPRPSGAMGSFPSATAWTPLLALAIIVTANGLLAGTWLFVTGVVMLVITVIGYAFELSAGGEPSQRTGSSSSDENTDPSASRARRVI